MTALAYLRSIEWIRISGSQDGCTKCSAVVPASMQREVRTHETRCPLAAAIADAEEDDTGCVIDFLSKLEGAKRESLGESAFTEEDFKAARISGLEKQVERFKWEAEQRKIDPYRGMRTRAEVEAMAKDGASEKWHGSARDSAVASIALRWVLGVKD